MNGAKPRSEGYRTGFKLHSLPAAARTGSCTALSKVRWSAWTSRVRTCSAAPSGSSASAGGKRSGYTSCTPPSPVRRPPPHPQPVREHHKICAASGRASLIFTRSSYPPLRCPRLRGVRGERPQVRRLVYVGPCPPSRARTPAPTLPRPPRQPTPVLLPDEAVSPTKSFLPEGEAGDGTDFHEDMRPNWVDGEPKPELGEYVVRGKRGPGRFRHPGVGSADGMGW